MAFPTTALIDAFTGANENPITTNWSGPLFAGEGQLQRISNALAGSAAANWTSSYIDLATYGPDTEVWITLSTLGATNDHFNLMVRAVGEGVAADGYLGHIETLATDAVRIYRVDDDAGTQLGADMPQEFAAGDGFGVEALGNAISVYRRASGVWSLIGTRTDSAYSAAGRIGSEIRNNTIRADDLGGGTLIPPPPPAADVAWLTA